MNEINYRSYKSISHKKKLHNLSNKTDKSHYKIPLYKTFNSHVKKNESTNTHNLLINDREQEFGNELLIKAMKKKLDKIELKEYLDDKNDITKKEFNGGILRADIIAANQRRVGCHGRTLSEILNHLLALLLTSAEKLSSLASDDRPGL